MCKYCEIKVSLPIFGSNTDAFITEGRNNTYFLYLTVMGFKAGIENINYCPMCGRRLGD